MSWYLAIRWLHVLSATAWFGEVVTINFVLIPAVMNMPKEAGADFLNRVFPRVFRLASVLAVLTVGCGIAMAYPRFIDNPQVLVTTLPGVAFLVGASMGIALSIFHFILEPRLEGMICLAAERKDFELSDRVIRMLRIVPRGGLAVITTIVVLMMVGARGL